MKAKGPRGQTSRRSAASPPRDAKPGSRRSAQVGGGTARKPKSQRARRRAAQQRDAADVRTKPEPRTRPVPRVEPPVEYSLLLTSALLLVTLGAVMIYSASSARNVLDAGGDGFYFLKRTLIYGAIGLVAMRFLSTCDLRTVRRYTPLVLGLAGLSLVAVLIPGVGVEVNGAHRWIGAGSVQLQPSELAKIALVLHAALVLSERPKVTLNLGSLAKYVLGPVLIACLLLMLEPDMGTAMVTVLTIGTLLIAAGVPMRILGALALCLVALALALIVLEPYRMARLTAFLNPGADSQGAGFQAAQARIAFGSGGMFGVGLGASVQKAFYLPEAHTDMIFAVIGEEWGLIGVGSVVAMFAAFGYAGLRTARAARDRYSKLLASGLTALVLCQAILNFFAVMGMAPLTGVPMPFVSYGGSSLIVMLAATGLLLGVARRQRVPGGAPAKGRRPQSRGESLAARLRVVDGVGPAVATRARPAASKEARDRSGDSSRGDRGARRARAGGRRRAAS